MTRYARLIRLILPATVVAGTLAWAPPAAAQTISVTTTAAQPGASGDCTLGEAIQAANTDSAVDGCAAGSGDDVISLPVGTYTQIGVDHTSGSGAVALPDIASNITIDGANPTTTIIERSTLEGTPAFMLFHMSVSTNDQCWPNCTLTLKDVGLQNAVGLGGGVTNLGGRTVLDNSTISGNTQGPTIRTTGRLTVRNSFVTNNSSTGQGGVFRSDGDASLTGTQFSFNTGGSGGVLYFGASATVTGSNNVFDSNTAETGGALSGAGTLDLSGSTFMDNMATSNGGGAIAGVTGTVRVASSFFDANFAGGSAGGAISSGAALTVSSSTFEDNFSDVGGAVSATGSSTTIRNSTFSANGANVRGGAIALSGGAATVANTTMAANFSPQGGAFSWLANGGTLALRNSLVATNSGGPSADCYSDSSITSQGYNLIGDATDCGIVAGSGDQLGTTETPIDPLLGGLDNNGGATKTHSLLAGSPAIDTGNPAAPGGGGSSCEQFDQRGQARPRDGDGDGVTFICDIGSYEGGTGLPLLTAAKSGTGTGHVGTVGDSKIDCGSDCAESYTGGTSVTLLATPTTDSIFSGWDGCATEIDDQCTVSMDSDKLVTATFTDVQSILSVTRTGAGQGSVSSDPEGIDCGLDCSELYSNGMTITLTASPANNSNFHFWSGCDSTNGPECHVTLDEDASVFASFSPIVRTLTINPAGNGTGTVTSDPEGIDCGSDCGEAFQIFSEVTLTAAPGPNSEFTGWSGCLPVDQPTCTLTINDHTSVTATFTAPRYQLSIATSGTGEGSITSSPAGIDCPGDCLHDYDHGTSVTLTPDADLNSEFTGWTGCDSTEGDQCTVEMTEIKDVTGAFTLAQRPLNVSLTGNGTGSISSSPSGIDCGLDCSATYEHGTSVTLTGTPGLNSTFGTWTGCDQENGNECTVAMNATENVSASFNLVPRTLTVTKDGTGSGSVTSSPAGVSCGSDCTQDYDHGTSVTLTAQPDATSSVAAWSGCNSTNGDECTVTMDAAKDVTVTFGPLQRLLSVSKTGNGSGTVATSFNTGIDCGVDCTETYDDGEFVNLQAVPDAGSAFVSWTGCGSVSGKFCYLQMNDAKNITASFTTDPQTLNVDVGTVLTGTGSVSSSPSGIDCDADCTEQFAPGTEVTLTATPGPNSQFLGWENCPGSTTEPQCVITMDQSHDVTAQFSPETRLLNVVFEEAQVDDSVTGTLTSDPVVMNCDLTDWGCGETFFDGTIVTLTAHPDWPYEVVSWQGCDSSSDNDCTVTLNADKTVTATFSQIRRPLNVTKAGTGVGTVSSAPAGIDCGSDCTHDYVAGSSVQLTPTPGTNSLFVGWSGCSSTSGDVCTVLTTADAQDVTANFGLVPRTLTVSKQGAGAGSVTSTPSGIDCGSDCSQDYEHGTSVTLTAVEGANSDFAGWTGCDTPVGNECTVAMDATKDVGVVFSLEPRGLDVSVVGDGSVESSPAGIDCGTDCSEDYPHGTSVTLTAVPGPNFEFVSWTGCDTPADNECTVAMDAAENVTASFGLVPRTLTVSKQGAGTGSVTSSPSGIDCGSDCSQDYEHGTSVTLTAVDGANSDFAGWSGCTSTNANECTVAMDAAKDVIASFALEPRRLDVSVVGNGSVSSSPVGIDCGADCSEDYDHGTSVTLTAVPQNGYALDSWSDCTTMNETTCVVAMTAAKTVTATFTLQPRTLTVTKSGSGAGSITSSPTGIDCGSTCSTPFEAGEVVTLTPSVGANSSFAGWTGCQSVTGTQCTVTMNADKTVNAQFTLVDRTLTIESRRIAGDSAAAGSVTSSVGGMNCAVPNDCSNSFLHGSVVVLTASPAANNVFSGWTNCDTPSGSTCTMTMNAAKTVRASFHNSTMPSSSITPAVQATNSATVDYAYTASPGAGLSLTAVELWINGPGAGGFVKAAEKTDGAIAGTFNAVDLTEGDGEYKVMTRARNTAGNYETGNAQTFLLDTTAPTSSVTTDTVQNVNTFDLTWNSNDSSDQTGVSSVQLWVDGPAGTAPELVSSDPGANGGQFTFTANEGAGAYAFHTIAEDGVGNREGTPGAPDVLVNVVLCAGYEDDSRIHIVGTAAKNTLTGTAAAEVICGLGGNDVMRGKGGSDLFVGGAGIDTVTYSERTSKQPVVVTINALANDGQKNEGDKVLPGIEILIGGAGNDVITGNGAANTIKGGLGNDILKGGGGADKLYGEKGKDKLDGGPKKDVCKTGETYRGCEVR